MRRKAKYNRLPGTSDRHLHIAIHRIPTLRHATTLHRQIAGECSCGIARRLDAILRLHPPADGPIRLPHRLAGCLPHHQTTQSRLRLRVRLAKTP